MGGRGETIQMQVGVTAGIIPGQPATPSQLSDAIAAAGFSSVTQARAAVLQAFQGKLDPQWGKFADSPITDQMRKTNQTRARWRRLVNALPGEVRGVLLDQAKDKRYAKVYGKNTEPELPEVSGAPEITGFVAVTRKKELPADAIQVVKKKVWAFPTKIVNGKEVPDKSKPLIQKTIEVEQARTKQVERTIEVYDAKKGKNVKKVVKRTVRDAPKTSSSIEPVTDRSGQVKIQYTGQPESLYKKIVAGEMARDADAEISSFKKRLKAEYGTTSIDKAYEIARSQKYKKKSRRTKKQRKESASIGALVRAIHKLGNETETVTVRKYNAQGMPMGTERVVMKVAKPKYTPADLEKNIVKPNVQLMLPPRKKKTKPAKKLSGAAATSVARNKLSKWVGKPVRSLKRKKRK